MERRQQLFHNSDFDVAPVMKMYVDAIDTWKKTYENFLQTMKEPQCLGGGTTVGSATEGAAAQWHMSAEELFKSAVEQQIEICRFFANRWEQYLRLPSEFAHCHSPLDVTHVQSAFLTQMATDYATETRRLAQPFQEFVSSLIAGQQHLVDAAVRGRDEREAMHHTRH